MDDLFKLLGTLFYVDEHVWERHANPWSVWTRIATFPILMLAMWSAHWIGWYCLIPLSLVAIWYWLSTRIFPAPASTQSWASRSVLGDRVYGLRMLHPIPVEQSNLAALLGIGSTVSTFIMGAGWFAAEPFTFVAAGMATIVFKLWLADRMTWLFDEMSEDVEEYRRWRR